MSDVTLMYNPFTQNLDFVGTGGGPSDVGIRTLTGNTGGAVGYDGSFNTNTLGSNGISVTGNPGTFTLTWALAGGGYAVESVNVDANTAPGTDPVVPTTVGVLNITGGQAAAGTTTSVIRTISLAANTFTVQIQRSSAEASTTIGANGVSHFSSAMFSVDANGFVTLAGGGQAVDSFIPNSGTSPVVPASDGSITLQGTGSITVVGGTNSLTPQLTGLTNHSLLVGAGTATITNLGVAANGFLPIGSVGADPVLAALTAGDGVSITNGAGSITISAVGSGLDWSDQSGAFAADVSNGYFITNTATATLPSSPANGSYIAFIVDTSAILTIQANTGQFLRMGSTLSISAGTAVNEFRGDSIELVYRTGSTSWIVLGAPQGNWAIT